MNAQTLATTCPLDCPDSCALQVSLNGSDVSRITGRRDHPTTAGFICSKVSRFGERMAHESRLLYPMRRVGRKGAGRFARISWDEAVREITTRFDEIVKQWGGEAILPYHYGGSNGLLTDGLADELYFARLGASRLDKTICAAPTSAVAMGMYGKMPGVAFEDYEHARCIIIWGANPKASNIHLTPFVRRAKKSGAFVATVDPVRNFSPAECDLHLSVRPGTDLAVALGLVRFYREAGRLDTAFLDRHAKGLDPLLAAADAWPLERAAAAAGIAVDDLRLLAETYAERSPAVLRCGWGVERNRNGGQAVAAILALPALLGKFGVAGGGYTMSNSRAARFDARSLRDTDGWGTRSINMTRLGAVLTDPLDPPIKALFVYNCNPVATVPDQNAVIRGLERDDLFTVVSEQVMTDTVRYADIVLPATTFLEHWDIRVGYGSYVVGGVRPVVSPRGEARSNLALFRTLGHAMGFTDALFQLDEQAVLERVIQRLELAGAPADRDTIMSGLVQRHDFPGQAPRQFDTVHPLTADGKIDLCPAVLGASPYTYREDPAREFPLALLSPATSKLISSTFGEFNLPVLRVTMHPDDAAARGVREGDSVRVFNDLGEVRCVARVSARVRPGVVSMPKGAWRKASGNGQTATALCPADVNEVAGGACFNDARVDVARLSA